MYACVVCGADFIFRDDIIIVGVEIVGVRFKNGGDFVRGGVENVSIWCE